MSIDGEELLTWLRSLCGDYEFDVAAMLRRRGEDTWPLTVDGPEELEQRLAETGHLLPLPREPAALANVLEVSIVDYLLRRIEDEDGVEAVRGTERGYPDLEIRGERFGPDPQAVDVKIAKLAKSGKKTQSRITLYTGNTYFRFPELHWPSTFRPFQDYGSHLDIIGIYRFDETSLSHVDGLQLIVHEAWRLGSKSRSSTTREYIGAVDNLDALVKGHGEFASPDEFYTYWRGFEFKLSKAVERQLKRLIDEQLGQSPRAD